MYIRGLSECTYFVQLIPLQVPLSPRHPPLYIELRRPRGFPATHTLRVVHLGRSTCHAISGRGGESTRILSHSLGTKFRVKPLRSSHVGLCPQTHVFPRESVLQGYLAHKKLPPPLGAP